MSLPPHPFKFTSQDLVIAQRFPTVDYEWEHTQPFRAPALTIVGASYQFDSLRQSVSPRDNAEEIIRFSIVKSCAADAQRARSALRTNLYRAGSGYLWLIDASDKVYRAPARLMGMPEIRGMLNERSLPTVCQFERFDDWADPTLVTVNTNVNATPTTFSITNPGNIELSAMTITLISNSATGFIDPVLTNLTNGYAFSSSRDATSNQSRLRIDTARAAVEYSSDAGVHYASDWANFVNGTNQVDFFKLSPGVNQITYSGGASPNLTIR